MPRLEFLGFETMIATENRRNRVSFTLHTFSHGRVATSISVEGERDVTREGELGCDVGLGGE